MSSLGGKIRFLYEVGFLGVCCESGQYGNISTEDYDFYFLNPRLSRSLEHQAVLEAIRFAVHPVFIEYLNLRINAQKPVMLLDWATIEARDSYD